MVGLFGSTAEAQRQQDIIVPYARARTRPFPSIFGIFSRAVQNQTSFLLPLLLRVSNRVFVWGRERRSRRSRERSRSRSRVRKRYSDERSGRSHSRSRRRRDREPDADEEERRVFPSLHVLLHFFCRFLLLTPATAPETQLLSL